MSDSIVIERDIKAPIGRVFKALISPEDLVRWHHAGDGWVTPYAEVDAKVGGKIRIGYSDAEGVQKFDFGAVISEINPPMRLVYYLQIEELINKDNRLVTYDLSDEKGVTHLRVEFDIEHLNDKELQRKGWSEHYDNLQTILEGN
jgi:uncharacterized protein YndB with AHSA1/START domain